MITVGLSSAMSFGMNQILLGFSTTATAVFGIWITLQNFSYMPIYGMNTGTLAIISYNYGARRLDRVRSVISLAMKAAIVLMLVLLAVFESIPGALLSLFNASENMLTIGITALRIAVVSLPFGAITLIFSSSFQALGRSLFTLILSLCRQVFFIIPIAWLLSLSGRLGLIWLAIPAAEAGSALLGALLRRKVYRGLGIRRHDAATE
jgi:Na+-driven multidrug efflux pump